MATYFLKYVLLQKSTKFHYIKKLEFYYKYTVLIMGPKITCVYHEKNG